MKIKSVLTVTLLFLLAVLSRAQGAHQAVLTWNASADAASNPNLGYNVYKLSSKCPKVGASGFTKLNTSPIAALTYTDTPLAVGDVVCYCVTATLNGKESVPSNTAGGTVVPGTVVLMLKIQ